MLLVTLKIYQLLWLIFSHSLADFAFQPGWMGKMKKKDPYTMLAHCVVWTGIITIVLILLGIFSPWKLAFLFLGHLACDSVKFMYLSKLKPLAKNSIDQGFHFLQLIIVWLF